MVIGCITSMYWTYLHFGWNVSGNGLWEHSSCHQLPGHFFCWNVFWSSLPLLCRALSNWLACNSNWDLQLSWQVCTTARQASSSIIVKNVLEMVYWLIKVSDTRSVTLLNILQTWRDFCTLPRRAENLLATTTSDLSWMSRCSCWVGCHCISRDNRGKVAWNSLRST